MNRPLRVLILEDWPDDAELMQRALRRAGVACTCQRVDTQADFLRALESEPDVILSDYNLPGWTGIDAFEELREAGHEIPFILVTGALGDTAAVECLQRGMADYVLKSNLERLPLAVRRALEMRRAQLERLRAEKQRAHIQSLLEAITTINQLIVRERDPQVLLQGACESLHRTRGYRSIWIGLLSEDGRTVQAVASAGAETPEEPVVVLVQEAGKGYHCVRTALTQREPYLVTDVRDSHPCASCPYRARIPHLSALAVPLLYQGQVYGVLVAHAAEPWSFAEDESALLEELAGDLALALHAVEEERKRREAEAGLRRRAGQLQTLLVAAQQLNTTLEVPAIMRSLVTAAMELTGATAGAAGLMEDGRMIFAEYNQAGTIYPVNLAYPPGHGVPGWIMETHKPYITNDAAHDPIVFRPVQQTLGFQSAATVPILSRTGELLGCFEVHDAQDGRPFDEQDLEMLQGLAGLASVALENALLLQDRTRAEERVQQLATKLKLAAHLARRTSTILDLEELAQQVVHSLQELTGCYNANFFLLEDDELVLVAGHGGYADGNPPIGFRLPLGEGIIGSAAVASEPLLVPDVSQEPRYFAWEGLPHTRSELAVPVKTGGRLLGVMDIQATEPDALDATDVEALEVLAGQLAAAIENARLYQAERRWAGELERSNRLMTALSQMAARIEMASNLDSVLETLGDELRQLGLTCFVALTSPDGEALRIRYVSIESTALKLAEKLTGYRSRGFPISRERWAYFTDLMEHGRGVFVRDVLPRAVELLPQVTKAVARRVIRLAGVTPDTPAILLPLKLEEEVLGILGVWGEDLRETDLPPATIFASQVAGALERTRLLEETRQRAEETAALLATAHAISTLDLDAVLEKVAHQAKVLFKADGSRIHLLEPDGETLRCGIALHKRAEAVMAVCLKLGQGITGRVALRGLPELIPNTLDDPDMIQVPDTPVEPETLALTPLKVRGRVIGVMTITRLGKDQPFTEANLALLTAFANQAAVAIENARLYEDIRLRATRLETLVEISSGLRTAITIEEIVPVFLRKATEVVGGVAGAIFLVEPDTGDLVAHGWHPPPQRDITGLRHRPGEGIIEHVATTGEVHISEELARDPMARILPGEAEELRAVRAAIALPLRAQEQVVGVLHVGLGERHAFTDEEVHLLTAIAEMAGSALHRAMLHEQTERRLQHISALRNIDMAISGSMDLRVALDMVLGQAMAQLDADAADILLLNSKTQTLEYAAGRGFRSRGIRQTRLRLGQGLAGRAALERRPVSVPDLREAGGTFARAVLAGEGFVAYYGVPLIAKGQVQGVLEVFHRAPLTPDAEWLGFLEAIAAQAAIAIDNATLFDELQRSNIELTMAYDATIEGWARALELRDAETEGHTRRVTEMAVQLARAMGLSDQDVAHIRRGALLHDIGKVGIPDSILLKPGPPTEEEWKVIHQHPIHAYNMLAPISFLRPALDIPYCHHEKWDGTGYPQGLKGEQIPLAARIFAVVDVYDALTSDRPYRDAWSEEVALEYIREQAGKHFDPQVVELFLRLMAEEKGT